MRGSGHLAARIRRTTAGRDKLLHFNLLPRPSGWWDRPEVFLFGSGPPLCGAAKDHAIGGPDELEAEGPRVIATLKTACCPGKSKIKSSVFFVRHFCGLPGPSGRGGSRRASSGGRAGVESSPSSTGGLAVFPGPGLSVSSGSFPWRNRSAFLTARVPRYIIFV